MPGPRPPVAEDVDVDGLLREARRVLDDAYEGLHEQAAGAVDGSSGDAADAALLLQALLVKDPHRISVKHDYHILRAVIGGSWGPRHAVAAAPAEGLLALVLAARLPLDGLLLAAQALYHALADSAALALLRALEEPPAAWKDAAVLALHHGLLAVAASLVPSLDDGENDPPPTRPGQLAAAPAQSDLRRAVVGAVLGATIKCTLRECRATSQRTKAAFKMLHAYLCTMSRWRRVPAELDEIAMLVSTSWEVPLPGVREANEAVLVQLQDLAVRSAAWSRPSECVAEAEAEALRRIRDTAGRWAAVLHATSWRSKDKYLQLKVLAPHLGRGALLHDMDAVLMDGLLLGMADPHLASAATSVYRVILTAIDVDAWNEHCFKHITRALASRDRKLVINVLNYWVSPTVKTFPSTLQTLLAAMKEPMASAMAGDRAQEHAFTHAAFLHLLKIGRKEGFWDPLDPEVSDYWCAAEWGLHHGDAWVRGLALAAVCVSARPRQPVSAAELAAAKSFLDANVRSDDTRLRHSLLESLGWLLMRVRTSLRTLLAAPAGDTEDNVDLVAAARFLADLHAFLLDGLQPGANYQRRATCLGVYRLLLSYLAPEPGQAAAAGLKKGVTKDPLPRSAVLGRHLSLGSAASRRALLNCIMDPTDDIRAKAAEVLAMLPADDQDGGKDGGLPTWRHVLALCNSQLFYQAESGAVLGAVLGSWEEHRVEPLDLVATCERQLAALRADVLGAASGGSPLHGLLGLVRRLLPPRGAQGRREAGPWAGAEDRLLRLLEANVDLCLTLLACRASSDSAFAPSFAEMGEAIDSMVSRTAPDAEVGDEDALTLSPAHQLVLNCIWLNLKTSCALASDLAEVDFPGLGQGSAARDFAERCARLPVVVLTRCRHKGAIEAAGTALQQVVKALTEQANVELRRLPRKLLMEFMSLLLEGSTAKGTSVSRRSAGMAILVHRVVLGDQQPEKPLLHDCISCLFELLGGNGSHPSLEGAQHDLPQTQALHFLRTLVADASLRVAMSPYICQAALFCFRHLNSPDWSIRNASLQLFGALVPKIVGQGKSSNDTEEDDDSLVGCINFGDLVVRFNPLCKLLLEILKPVPADTNVLKNQAELIPALSLLARLSVSEVTPWCEKEYKCVKSAFVQLLSSPISVVRSLAAKAFSRFTPLVDSAKAFEELLTVLREQHTENGRYGVLVAMKLLKEHLSLEGQLTKAANTEKAKMSHLICNKFNYSNWNKSSYASQAVVLSVLELQTGVETVENCLLVLSNISSISGQSNIGLNQWVTAHVKYMMTACSIEALPAILNKSLSLPCSTDIPRTAALHVHRRLNENVAADVMQEILDVCLNHVGNSSTLSNYETFHVLNIILKIVVLVNERQTALKCDIKTVSQLSQDFSSSKFGARCKAISLPIVAGLTTFSFAQLSNAEKLHYLHDIKRILEKMTATLEKYSLPDNDEDHRFAAATALRFIGAVVLHSSLYQNQAELGVNSTSSTTTTLILHTAVQLIQDEDCRVRDEASKFVTHLCHGISRTLNSLECLEILLSHNFLCPFLGSKREVVMFLWKFLSLEDIESNLSKVNNDIENPFDHGSKNIFSEEIWIVEKAAQSLTNIVNKNFGEEILSSSIDGLTSSIQLQNKLTGQETTNQRKSDYVRENWQATAMCLHIRKINYRFEILLKVMESKKLPTFQKMYNLSEFTVYF